MSSYYEKFPDGKVVCIDEEIPFEIPEGWEWARIRNVSQSYIGLTYSPGDVASEGTVVLRSSNIKDGKLVLDDIVKVKCQISEKLYVEENDILICARNGSAKLVGKAAIIPHLNEKMSFGAFMAICKTPIYKFVYLFLQSDLFFSQLREVSGTTTINQLTQNNFNGFLIPIPPIDEQDRIVEKVSSIAPILEKYSKSQDALDHLNQTIKKELRSSILQEAIQGKLVPQNSEDEPAEKLLERINTEKHRLVKEGKLKAKDAVSSVIFKGEDNKYYEQIGSNVQDISEEIPFEIPDSWIWCRFGNIVKIHIGKTPPRGESKYWVDGTYPWVAISDMNNSGHIKNTKEKISLTAATSLMGNNISHIGDLLMSFKLTVGKTAILDIDAFHNEAIITIAQYYDENNIVRDYLFNILPVVSNLGDSKDAIKGKTLNSQSLFNLLIPLPPIQEQQRIVQKIDEIQTLIQ